MKTWRSIAALTVVAGASVGLGGAWSALGQQGTPSQAPSPRQEDRTRSPSRQDQPPAQSERDRRNPDNRQRNQDPDNDDGGVFDDDDGNSDVQNSREQRERAAAATRESRENGRRPFAFDDPAFEGQFNRTVERLAAQERELAERNQDLLRRLGEARSMRGDQRVDALAAIIQESLREQERMLQYLSDARTAWGGSGSSASDDGTLRQDEMNRSRDRRTPLERESTDTNRDGRQPGRSEQPQPNPR